MWIAADYSTSFKIRIRRITFTVYTSFRAGTFDDASVIHWMNSIITVTVVIRCTLFGSLHGEMCGIPVVRGVHSAVQVERFHALK